MAMTMSDNMSASNDWFQFYQQQQDFHGGGGGGVPSSISEATTVTTVVSTADVTASNTQLLPNMLNSTSSASTSATTGHHLSPEGRVAKPVRRRTRASRRTPTTLLNTDTTNFRAMVQQFTGGPIAPFAPTPSSTSSGLASLGFGFGYGPRQAHIGPTGLMVGQPAAGYHLQQQQPQVFQQQNLSFQSSNTDQAGDQSRFFQRLNNNSNSNNSSSSNNNSNSNPRASNNATDLGIGGFVMDHHGSLGRF